jgi:O-antigen ligase
MKKALNISTDPFFYLLLSFIFMLNFSIAYCYISGILLLTAAVVHHVYNRIHPVFPRPFLIFIPLIAFTLISTYFSMEPGISIKDNRELLNFLLIPLIILIINSRRRLMISLFTLLVSTLLSSVFGIYTIIQSGRISVDQRLKGLTSHWMTYSELLMLVFIFFVVYLFFEKRLNIRLFTGIVLSFIGISIVLSLTRSVWIGTLISLGIFILYHRPVLIKYSIPVLIFIVVLLPSPVKGRITSIFDFKYSSNRDRLVMIQKGLNIFLDYPLFGVGSNYLGRVIDTYPPAFEKPADPPAETSGNKNISSGNMHLHNNFIHILAERGIFALAAFLFAFGYLLFDLFRKTRRGSPALRFVSTGSLFAVIGFLLAGFFEYNFGDSEVLFMLLFFISLPYLRFLDYKDDHPVQS